MYITCMIFLTIIVAFMIVLMIRNNMIFSFRRKIITLTFNHQMEAIRKGYINLSDKLAQIRDDYLNYSYHKMVFDFRKWKFEDFFGDFEDKLKQQFEENDKGVKNGT